MPLNPRFDVNVAWLALRQLDERSRLVVGFATAKNSEVSVPSHGVAAGALESEQADGALFPCDLDSARMPSAYLPQKHVVHPRNPAADRKKPGVPL